MKIVKLKEDLVICGVPRHASEGPLTLEDDAADALVASNLAEIAKDLGDGSGDGLDDKTVHQLAEIADAEQVPLAGITRKADILTAIREHRAAPIPPALIPSA